MTIRFARGLIAGAVSLIASLAAAQTYPTKPITVIVPFAAGGPTDTIARLYGEQISKQMAQPVLIENVTGAGGVTGTTRAKAAEATGYVLLVHNVAPFVAGPTLYANVAYSPNTDFMPIASLAEAAIYVVVRKDFPAKTLSELIAYAKVEADRVSFASAGSGSATHLACELLMQKAGIKMTHIPYRGTGPALNDLVSGKVDMMCDQGLNVGSQLRAGNVRALAIAQNERSQDFPEVPTAAEAGLKDFTVNASTAAYAPKGTPKAVIDALARAINTAASNEATKTRVKQLVSEIPAKDRLTPDGLGAFTRSEEQMWGRVIRDGGIKLN